MIYDISPPIDESLAVWPGDTPMTREVLCDMRKGDNLTLSTLHATVHLGAHADAPSHYGADADSIERRSLDLYIGPCEVLHLDAARGKRIGVEALPHAPNAPRVLFATGTYPDPSKFNEDFAALTPDLIDHLAAQGVGLVGIDTPSIDLSDSKDLPSHHAVLRHDMAILEGLRLARVPAGVYELIAPPLPLVGFDASPVRALLRDVPTSIQRESGAPNHCA